MVHLVVVAASGRALNISRCRGGCDKFFISIVAIILLASASEPAAARGEDEPSAELTRLRMRIDTCENLLANAMTPPFSTTSAPLSLLPFEPGPEYRALSESSNATPTAAPTACADDDAAAEAILGLDCQTLTAQGYCNTYLCRSCTYARLCDTSCGFCDAPTTTPTAAPTPTTTSALDCVDYDAEVSASSGGFDCSTLASMGYCDSTFCPTCDSSGYCDVACGYCPTPAPTASPCVDYDAEVSASSGGFDCSTLASMGYCASEFCPTCGSSGYCDVACGYCSESADSEGAPSPSPTSSNPTATFTPTTSHAPTLTGVYDVSSFTELYDAINTAEDDRPWVLTLTGDISGNDTIYVRQNKNIKVIGSSALGRRARITPGVANPPGFISDCNDVYSEVSNAVCDHEENGLMTLWLENLDISGFSAFRLDGNGATQEQTSHAVRVSRYSTLTLENCRLSENRGSALVVQHLNTVLVRGSEFVDNRATLSGAGISIGRFDEFHSGNVVEVIDSIFVRNIATTGAAIYAKPDTTLRIRNCSMLANRADAPTNSYGGAVVLEGDLIVTKTLTIQDSLFRNNTVGDRAGALYTGSNIILEISNSMFADNAAYGTGGGAVWTSADNIVTVTSSIFERNHALAGAGGALLTFGTELHLIDVNFTDNVAATDGGAVQSNAQTVVYPRGTTRFARNSAREHGGAISLDASSLKTNEAALVFDENEARLGGALSVVNEGLAFVSAGCRTVTFEMNWALSSALQYAENTNSALLRRIRNGNVTAISPEDITDDRGEWTILFPSGAEDTSASFCLTPGEYELMGSEGAYCFEGWGGGHVRVLDIEKTELLSYFTVPAGGECTVTTQLIVPEDDTLTKYRGDVLFEGNRATGTAPGFCGMGCGGALYVGESSAAEIDRVDFAHNSAADGGALFVDLMGDLSLSRVMMRSNSASRDGGAMSVGTIATVSMVDSTAKHNVAGGSGGMLHLSGVMSATLQGIDATGNTAGATGGAVAAFDATRTKVALTNSSIRGQTAGGSGGGLFLEDSVMGLVGVELSENSADAGDGGAVATSGADTFLEIDDAECVHVDVLLDWTSAGIGCPVAYYDLYTCDPLVVNFGMSCAELPQNLDFEGHEDPCNGCPCNDKCASNATIHANRFECERNIVVVCPSLVPPRINEIYEKYFVVQNARDTFPGDSVDYESNSVDFNNDEMRGLPAAGALSKFSFCCAPGEYSINAIDTVGDGWWGGAYYSVLVDGVAVVREEMNRTSSSRQTTPFTVTLPPSARTNFTSNKALQGGGGAMFWDNAPPENAERYREKNGESNVALYGGFAATPARNLTATRRSYHAYSGRSMNTDPIVVELKDE